MSQEAYTIEVTNLSSRATEGDLYDFFSFSGAIDHVEIIRSGDYASTAYVTFKEPHALETAVLLSGATIMDQPVCITRWGHYDDHNFWQQTSWGIEEETVTTHVDAYQFNTTPREALTVAQDMVKTMLSKGYTLSKDALSKAKAFDESHQVSTTAVARVADLSKRIGLTDKINTSVGAVRSVDDTYHVSDTTKTVVSVTGKTAAKVTNAVVTSSYFSAGAMFVSDALTYAAKMAADLASHGRK